MGCSATTNWRRMKIEMKMKFEMERLLDYWVKKTWAPDKRVAREMERQWGTSLQDAS